MKGAKAEVLVPYFFFKKISNNKQLAKCHLQWHKCFYFSSSRNKTPL